VECYSPSLQGLPTLGKRVMAFFYCIVLFTVVLGSLRVLGDGPRTPFPSAKITLRRGSYHILRIF